MENTQNPQTFQEQTRAFLVALLHKTNMYTTVATDPQYMEDYLRRMGGLLEERIGLSCMKKLGEKNPQSLEEFEALVENEKYAEIEQFLHKNLPDYEDIRAQAMVSFGKEFMQDIKK